MGVPTSETEHPRKRRRDNEYKDSGGCMAYILWKMGIFGTSNLSDVKNALNSEMEEVFHSFNFMRRKRGLVRYPCAFSKRFPY